MRYLVGAMMILAMFAVGANAACFNDYQSSDYNYLGTVLIDGTPAGAGLVVYILDAYNNSVVQSNGTTDSNGEYDIILDMEDDCLDNITDGAAVQGESIYFYVGDTLASATSAGIWMYMLPPIETELNLSINDTTAPSAPGSVNAVEVTPGTINVSWTAATDDLGVQDYVVYRSQTSGLFGGSPIGNSTSLNYMDTATANGSTYYYIVRARDTANIGSGSSEANVTTTDSVAPGVVTGFNVSNDLSSEHRVQASWDAVTDADFHSYTIWYSTDNLTFDVFNSGITSSNEAMSIPDGVTYYFVLGARDDSGNFGSNTSVVEAISYDNKAPVSTSATLNSTDSVNREDEVYLEWGGFTAQWDDIAGYLIFRDSVLIANLIGDTNTSYNDTGVSDGTLYTYSVSAYDDVPNYSSNITGIVTPVDDLVPAAVTGETIITNNMSANVSWSAVTTNSDASAIADLVGYRVYMNTTGSWGIVYQGTELWYYNGTLPNNIPYYFRITAYDDAGNEGTPVLVSGTPSERPVMTAVPGDSSYLQSGDLINLTFSSGITLDAATYSIYNLSMGLIANYSNVSVGVTSLALSIDTTGWDEDGYLIVTYASDTNAPAYTNFSYVVDDTAPVATSAVTSYTYAGLTRMVEFNVSITETNPVTVVMNNTNQVTMTDAGSGIYTVTTNATALGCTTDGICNLDITATDAAGNIGTTTVSFIVDTIAPKIVNPIVSAQLVRSTDSILFNVTLTEANLVDTLFLKNGGTTVAMSNRSLTDWYITSNAQTLGCSEGVCNIYFIATDMAANQNNTEYIALTVDDSAPEVTGETISVSEAKSTANFVIDATVSDAIAVNTVTVSVAGGSILIMTNTSATAYTITTNGTALGCSEGLCTITINATDALGNENSSQTVQIRVDDTAPAVVSVAASEAVAQGSKLINFTAVITDAGTIVNVTLHNDSYVTMTNIGGNLYSAITMATVIDCNAPEQECRVMVHATDAAGNINDSESATFIVDDVTPRVTGEVVSLTAAKSSDSFTVNVSITDSNTVTSVMLTAVNGTPAAMLNRSLTDYYLTTDGSTMGCSEGTCTLTVTATDEAGNVNDSVTLEILIDDSAPTVLDHTDNIAYIPMDRNFTVIVNATDISNVSAVWLNQSGTILPLTPVGTNGYTAITNAVAMDCTDGVSCYLDIYSNDTLGNVNTTDNVRVIASAPAVISVVAPTDDIIVQSKTGDVYDVLLNFTTNEAAACYVKTYSMELSSASDCQVVSCSDTGCTYSCSAHTATSQVSELLEGNATYTEFSYGLNLSDGYMYQLILMCEDDYMVPSNQTITWFTAREKALTLEWASVMRSTLIAGQYANFNGSVTNVYNISSMNVTVLYPNNSTSTTNVVFSRTSAIDQNVYYDFTNTTLAGNYTMIIEIFDIMGHEVNTTETFSVYGSSANHTVSTGGGELEPTVEYIDPSTGTVISVGGNGTEVVLPNTTIQMEMDFADENVTVIIPTLNFDLLDTTVVSASRLATNITETTVKIGANASTYRYNPLGSYAVEIANASDYNSTFRIRFDYSDLNISDPTDLVIYKSVYNFSNGTPDYSSGTFYRYGNSAHRLYVNTTEEYVYIIVDSFSSFMLGEDRKVAEVCGDGIDNDYDGSVDEGCTSSSSSSSSSGGGSSGGTGGVSTGGSIYRTAFQKIDAGKYIDINITRSGLPISGIRFTAVNALEEVSITAQGLSAKPADVTELENTYMYLKVTMTNMVASDIRDNEYGFTIPRTWFDDEGVSRDAIMLYLWDGSSWSEVDTERTGSTAADIEYTAYTTETGYLAIALKVTPEIDVVEEPVEEEVEEVTEDESVEEDITGEVTIDLPDEEIVEPESKRSIVGYIVGIFCLFLAAMAVVSYEIKRHHDEHMKEKKEAEGKNPKDQPKDESKGHETKPHGHKGHEPKRHENKTDRIDEK